MAEAKIFDLDQPLVEVFPLEEFKHENWEKITARQVLSHQTGLIDDGTGQNFQFNPGEGYRYSGAAYWYFQKAIEHKTGKSLEQLAKDYIFDPLEMKHSSFLRLEKFQIALGHFVDGKPNNNKSYPQNESSGCAPVSLHTTAHDFALFINNWLKESELLGAFTPQIYMTKDQWAKDQQVSQNDLRKIAWGLGWGLQITSREELHFIGEMWEKVKHL